MTDLDNESVLSIVANIKKSLDGDAAVDSSKAIPATTKPSKVEKTKNITMKGKPKSGKFWKSEREKFSSINKTKGKQDFQRKTALRLELLRTKELSRQVQEQLKQKQEEKKERRRENLKRAEENKRKAEIVQVITNSAKLKRMRKKQLRFIQKRDTNKEVEASK